jgi:hypothetical protein
MEEAPQAVYRRMRTSSGPWPDVWIHCPAWLGENCIDNGHHFNDGHSKQDIVSNSFAALGSAFSILTHSVQNTELQVETSSMFRQPEPFLGFAVSTDNWDFFILPPLTV